ncbi:MAG: hypothetical protein P1V20_07415 [Verrucomicrobiales bacterium]|nr:hypothetical protein [Verrucomicrobiales bacterium]
MIRRFTAVLWKEWKGLQPFYFLLVALFVFGLVLVQFVDFMDEYPIWDKVIKSPGDSLIITYILCMVGVLGVLTREKDEGILTYLDGLPVSRLSMYIAKGFLVFLMVSMLDIFWIIESMLYDILSRESDSPPMPWNHIGTFLFLNTFLIAFFVCTLLPLSFLRLWSLLVIAAWFLILGILKTVGIPFVTWLDPFELMQPPEEIDDKWVIPWKHISVLSVIAGFSWITGLSFYGMMSAVTGRKAKEFITSRWGKVLIGTGVFGGLVILMVLTSMLFYFMDLNGELPEEPTTVTAKDIRPAIEGGNAIATAATEKFEFVYRKKMEKRVKTLAKDADDILRKVAEYLEADGDATTGRITVDFSNPLGSHNAGQAYWKKIRMAFPEKLSGAEAKAILGHEVTHVLINNMTGSRLEEAFASARWFHEGLASYVEFTLFREKEAALDYERWLALSSTWGEVNFQELVSSAALVKSRDPNLVYPAGMEWIRAAVDVYGDDCPAKLLKALGRPDAPPKLEGLALWRDACLVAGYDLERIRSRFRVRLKNLRETHKEVCAKLPEVKKGTAERKDGKIVITPELPEGWREKAPKGAEILCRPGQMAIQRNQ